MSLRTVPARRAALLASAALTGVLTSGSMLTAVEAAPTSGTTAIRDEDGVVTTTVTTDPDDTPGALDIAAVRHRVRQLSPPHGAVRVRWTLRTSSRSTRASW